MCQPDFNNESESATLSDVKHEKDITETEVKDSEQTIKDEKVQQKKDNSQIGKK